jgi:hypothetical protein
MSFVLLQDAALGWPETGRLFSGNRYFDSHGESMEDPIAEELVNIIKKNQKSDYEEAFERAFELTKSYAGSANAQASVIPFVFEKLFELFVTGKTKS